MNTPSTEAIKSAATQQYPNDTEGFRKGAEWAIKYIKDKNK